MAKTFKAIFLSFLILTNTIFLNGQPKIENNEFDRFISDHKPGLLIAGIAFLALLGAYYSFFSNDSSTTNNSHGSNNGASAGATNSKPAGNSVQFSPGVREESYSRQIITKSNLRELEQAKFDRILNNYKNKNHQEEFDGLVFYPNGRYDSGYIFKKIWNNFACYEFHHYALYGSAQAVSAIFSGEPSIKITRKTNQRWELQVVGLDSQTGKDITLTM